MADRVRKGPSPAANASRYGEEEHSVVRWRRRGLACVTSAASGLTCSAPFAPGAAWVLPLCCPTPMRML